eukprot:Mrub_06907.p1 GENE.Mrub_06907~~Mrub_06907.p1  ORF type:complete len:318 (-),score=47.48 Mrub_06907:12-938(-)
MKDYLIRNKVSYDTFWNYRKNKYMMDSNYIYLFKEKYNTIITNYNMWKYIVLPDYFISFAILFYGIRKIVKPINEVIKINIPMDITYQLIIYYFYFRLCLNPFIYHWYYLFNPFEKHASVLFDYISCYFKNQNECNDNYVNYDYNNVNAYFWNPNPLLVMMLLGEDAMLYNINPNVYHMNNVDPFKNIKVAVGMNGHYPYDIDDDPELKHMTTVKDEDRSVKLYTINKKSTTKKPTTKKPTTKKPTINPEEYPKYHSSLAVKNRSVYDKFGRPIIDNSRNGMLINDERKSNIMENDTEIVSNYIPIYH